MYLLLTETTFRTSREGTPLRISVMACSVANDREARKGGEPWRAPLEAKMPLGTILVW